MCVASAGSRSIVETRDRKSTRLNSSHTVIYTLSLHDALPIFGRLEEDSLLSACGANEAAGVDVRRVGGIEIDRGDQRSEEHTSELQSHSDLHSFPTRRSSDLRSTRGGLPPLRLRRERGRWRRCASRRRDRDRSWRP